MTGGFPPLAPEQAQASHPRDNIWVSASAGTGKTQVLAARVFRLLLNGERPDGILCLTFTKAGAAEMAERIHERLGLWVTMKDSELFNDLKALGEKADLKAQAHARTLFASVLDARGGGLRIQTIHSFCQSLLQSFPAEADLVPGFRPIEDREEAELHQQTLAALVSAAQSLGTDDHEHTIERLQALRAIFDESGVRKHLRRCASSAPAMEALGSEVGPRLCWWFGIDPDTRSTVLADACRDAALPLNVLDAFCQSHIVWGTKTGTDRAQAIGDWLRLDANARAAALPALHLVWAKADGDMRSFEKQKNAATAVPLATELYDHFRGLVDLRSRLELIALYETALLIGQTYARRYTEAKRSAGVVDFNDLITATVGLLTSGQGAWIRYKLDASIDHLLIDEAQDTNAQQWKIIEALTEDFYAGSGARGDIHRTLFTVGDYKQAIFGFQGTHPRHFNDAHDRFAAEIAGAGRELKDVDLNASFRSGQPVLDAVDAMIAEVGADAFGLPGLPERHVAFGGKKASGQVVLWPPFIGTSAEEDAEGETAEPDSEEESWVTPIDRQFARRLAEQVKAWVDGGLYLRNEGRPVRPGDVMILLRSRKDMARLIVSRLHDAKVPVAGVDRLKLNAPIAVLDCLAAIRFVLQPDDDLNLASLLVSPLVGWSQDDLWEHGQGRDAKYVPLWQHLGDAKPQVLREMLGMADTATPYRFLETILSGAIAGRRKLLARLGEEARDPIESLLNQALEFEKTAPPSLQTFIDWFDRDEVELKRAAGKAEDGVRVMTMHGAKGLQAPVVVLADATYSFERRPKSEILWDRGDVPLPLFRPRKELVCGPVTTAIETADLGDLQEHWRLLYVAMTRAEEHLFIGGALTPTDVKALSGGKLPPDTSWHWRVEQALRALPGVDEAANGMLTYKVDAKEGAPKDKKAEAASRNVDLPEWVREPAKAEARPPRPLAPSALGVADSVADPPPSADLRKAAERGTLLHALFERLPGTPPDERRAAALGWLERASNLDAVQRAEIVDHALSVIDDPSFGAIFSADALAEAPLAGVIGGQVIAGTADRLLITPRHVLVVDFKTGRRVPRDVDGLPETHVAQMAAYVAVLEGLFADRPVRAALLYTAGPKLIAVPPAMLAAHKPGYQVAEDNLDAAG